MLGYVSMLMLNFMNPCLDFGSRRLKTVVFFLKEEEDVIVVIEIGQFFKRESDDIQV